jgi:hypothetical protein
MSSPVNGASPATSSVLGVSMARIEVKLENVVDDIKEMKTEQRTFQEETRREIGLIKGRQFPLPILAAIMSTVGTVTAIWALVHAH